MSWETALDRQIHDYLPDLKWVENEPMAKHTSFRIGGPAKRMAFPKTREQLVVLMGFLQDAGIEITEMSQGCIGSLSQLYDGNPPFNGRGAISHATNIAEVLRTIRTLHRFESDKQQ